MEQDPIRWLYDLQHFGVKLGLDNIRALLGVLGRPQRAFPSIHVGGTNGKGSVSAMLASMIDASGRRSGLFTSPHLVRPNERVRIAGNDIATADLHRWLRAIRQDVERALGGGRLEVHPSFFEVVTATALAAFREAGVECAVLEVGLGGRLDATNAVEGRVSVIVTVDLDHMKTLGPTLERIAREKAGIIKSGRPLVTAAQQPEALAVLREVAAERGAPLIEAPRAAAIEACGPDRFAVYTERQAYRDLAVSLPGRHQWCNARTAIVAFEALAGELGWEVDPAAVGRALGRVRWPGRLQWVEAEPPLLLDGAHNASGARVLADHLRVFADDARGRALGLPVLLFGAMRGKDLDGILAPLVGLVRETVVTRPGVERSLEPAEVAEAARRVLGAARVVADPRGALDRARELAGPRGYVLVAGSLYLVGQVLGMLEAEPVPGPVSM